MLIVDSRSRDRLDECFDNQHSTINAPPDNETIMATNVDVPPLGESVREAVLIKWHKNDGDTVADQEPVAELETDKANVDVPAPRAGVLRRVKNEGDTVAIGDTIARIDDAGSGNAKPAAPAKASSPPLPPTPGFAGRRRLRWAGRALRANRHRPPSRRPRHPTSSRRAPPMISAPPSAASSREQAQSRRSQGHRPGGKVTKEDATRLVRPARPAPTRSARTRPARWPRPPCPRS
jgi:2-oxoglutarate dehydrogenase E2 component (dihydrolipoamide succinyltransferase)